MLIVLIFVNFTVANVRILCDFRELRAKVSSLSTKVEKLGKLDTKLKSAFYACRTLDDVEHLVCIVCNVQLQCFH